MADEGEIGRVAAAGAAPLMDAGPAASQVMRTRLIGAGLAAILALLATLVAVRIDALVYPDPLDSPIATVFGPTGIAGTDATSMFLVWAVAPLAAAIAGVVFAVPAAGRVARTGLWMGCATYVIAILISPIALALAPEGRETSVDLGLGLIMLGFLWVAAGALLAPLLGVCLVAGTIWATLLRRVVGAPPIAGPLAALPLWPVVALGVSAIFGWTIIMAMFGAMSGATGFD